MKRHSFLLVLLALFCVGCEKENTQQPIKDNQVEQNPAKEDETPKEGDETPEEKESLFPDCRETYNEPVDSLEGLSRDNLDDFRIALGKAKSNFVTYSEFFLNQGAKDYYKINYKEDFRDEYKFTHQNIDIFTEENFILEDTYRLSKSKIEINNSDVINKVLSIVAPELKNEGYFLTFKRATIELNEQNEFYRFRVYANTTQVGKLIETHQKEENTNWYLLFGQCYFLTDEEAK